MGASCVAGSCSKDSLQPSTPEVLSGNSDAGDVSVQEMGNMLSAMKSYEMEPLVVTAKDGSSIRIRMATMDDKRNHMDDILDTAGTGSGIVGDPLLLNYYECFIEDPETVTIWAEELEPPNHGLGMVAVTLSSYCETFIHSLRVGQASRGKGVAEKLVAECCRVAVHIQGADSIGRWGVVSSNDIMVKWSARRQLEGPTRMVRYVSKPEESRTMDEVLPSGWSFRLAAESDEDLIYRHFVGEEGSFDPISRDYCKGVRLKRYGAWHRLNKDTIAKACRQERLPSGEKMGVRSSIGLLFDKDKQLAAFGHFGCCLNATTLNSDMLLFGTLAGTRGGMQSLAEAARLFAKQENCEVLLGYVAEVDWMEELMKEAQYMRPAETAECVFEWKNAEFCS